jgi:hypothetical protein
MQLHVAAGALELRIAFLDPLMHLLTGWQPWILCLPIFP